MRNRHYKVISKRNEHGLSKHPLYQCFLQARARCTNRNNKAYKTYEGKFGKNTVLELTLYYLDEYERKVSERPDIRWSIDRIDNDGAYEIGNVTIMPLSENASKNDRDVVSEYIKAVQVVDGKQSLKHEWVRLDTVMK